MCPNKWGQLQKIFGGFAPDCFPPLFNILFHPWLFALSNFLQKSRPYGRTVCLSGGYRCRVTTRQASSQATSNAVSFSSASKRVVASSHSFIHSLIHSFINKPPPPSCTPPVSLDHTMSPAHHCYIQPLILALILPPSTLNNYSTALGTLRDVCHQNAYLLWLKFYTTLLK